ncbi:hypothetical protein DES45_109103 [Microvirga subterranea]|uniref:Uncharacterized protein n=1 Tax=Microvirga subterranea TaxID=186651 RepID=A0A370HHI9_9HYPH|nr:hypothetical protein DES45_109103 [Microvirga subterranea]
MVLEHEPRSRRSAQPSPSDLQQIKDAVGQLRAVSPGSALAELVEEKIRILEHGGPTVRRVPAPGRPRP